MKKIIPIIIVVVVVAVGFFVYETRPVQSPTEDIKSQTVPVEPVPEASTDSTSKTYAISQTDSTSSFTITEELRGSPATPVGTTNSIAGEFSVTADKAGAQAITIGTIKIDARTFKTDSSQRDGAIVRFILKSETAGNEYITFTPTDKAIPFKNGEPFAVKGNLAVSGVTKPVTFSATATVKDGVLTGSTSSTLKRSDFNLTIPSIPFVANVSDTFTVKAMISAAQKK